MIERLEGEILDVGAGHLLINLGGLGIRVTVPRGVAQRMEGQKSAVLWTRLLVRDSEPQLYGFHAIEERICFDALLSVSGVGPRIAIGILSILPPETLALEAERGSTDQLITVSGVGKKLASRIVLELRGRLPLDAFPVGKGETRDETPDLGSDAVRALTALGYPVQEAREAVRAVLKNRPGEAVLLDDLLREALTGMNRAKG